MTAPPWFFAPPESWTADEVALPPDESHHAMRVMRISPPDVLTVFDGRGTVARCAAARAEEDILIAEVLEQDHHRPLHPHVVIYQAAAKANKLDDVVERLAELGASELWAYESERSVARWDRTKVEKLRERWFAIARSAAKQSRNPFLLQAHAGLSWTELLRRLSREPLVIVLWEEGLLPLRTAFSGAVERVALVVGPEGGLTRGEAEELADAGGQLVSLGPRILRTENAPVVAAAAVLYHYGLIG